MKQIDIFPWDNHFNTGLPLVDEQHRKLVEIINTLATRFAFNTAKIDLSTIFDELLAYTRYHFETEEGIWMEAFEVSESLLAHQKSHAQFVAQLELLIAAQQGQPLERVAEKTLDVLVQWLAGHILESDRLMAYRVAALHEGLSQEAAQESAKVHMSGHTRHMIDIVLNIYKTLSHNTLQLMRELTLQHKLEHELAAKEQMLRATVEELLYQRSIHKTLIQTLPDLVWLKDADGVYLACNPRFEQFFGATEGEIVGKTDYHFVAKELADAFRMNDQIAIERNEATINKEWVTFVTDGHRELLETTKTPMYDEQLRLIGVLGIGHDITAQRQNEERLAEAEYRYRLIFDESPDGINIADPRTGKFLVFNTKAHEMLGYHREEYAHLCIGDLEVLEDHQIEVSMKRIMQQGHGEVRTKHRHKNGTWIDVMISVKVIELGGLTYLHSIMHDITQEERIKAELERSRAEAIEASHTKSEFLANMSHEIRTPLNGIIGLTDLALSASSDPLQRDYLTKAQSSSRALMRILNDILDYSKLEAGRLSLERIDFSIAELAHTIHALFAFKAREKRIEFSLMLDPLLPPWLKGDVHRLTQVLNNLVGNALKFTQEGIVALHVKRIDESTNRIKVQFEIHDSGIGLSPSQQSMLFEAFRQADTSHTRRYGGTGLGLAICRQLVTLMGGVIWVNSEEGRGSQFSFWVELEGGCERIEATQRPTSHKLQGIKVLLVEDNDINRIVATEALKSAGIEVEIAQNGQIGVEKALHNRFDLILMDIQMPVMDGFEATRKIRQHYSASELPIIAMSAAVMREDVEQSLEAGMNDHIGKPFEREGLWDKIGMHLHRDTYRTTVSQQAYLLDSARALALLKGDQVLYRTVLEHFIEQYAYADAEILRLINSGDGEARRMVHTLKGLANQIGATSLYQAAQSLEAALHSADAMKELPLLTAALAQTLEAIRHELAHSQTS